MTDAANCSSSDRLLLFEVGGRHYALPIADVAEGTEGGCIAAVPTLRAAVGGVMNHHGEALPVVRPAALFELGVGQGRLLVCTFNLDMADPAGVYLLDTLLAYAQSASFHPRTWVDAPAFVRWVGGDQEWVGTLETDQGFDQRGQLPPVP